MVPVSEVDLAAFPAVAGGGPGEARSVRGGDRQPVEAVRGGDPHRLLLAGHVHQVHLEVAESQLVRGEQDVLEGGVDIGRPAHGPEVGEPALVAPVRIHRPDVRNQPVLREAPPDDPRPVGEVERAPVVAGHVGQAPLFAAVGAHGPDLAEVRRIDFGEPGLPLREVVLEHAPHRGEDDPRAVRRPASLGVVAVRVGEADEFAVRAPFHEDVHVGVVVPLVAALLAALPELDLLPLQLERTRVEVGRGEQDVPVLRGDERAGGLAVSRRHASDVAGFHREQVDLEEGVPRFPLRLEDHLPPVGGEVALAGAPALDRQAADTAQEPRLVVIPLPREDGTGQTSAQRNWKYEHEAAGYAPQRLEHGETRAANRPVGSP